MFPSIPQSVLPAPLGSMSPRGTTALIPITIAELREPWNNDTSALGKHVPIFAWLFSFNAVFLNLKMPCVSMTYFKPPFQCWELIPQSHYTYRGSRS